MLPDALSNWNCQSLGDRRRLPTGTASGALNRLTGMERGDRNGDAVANTNRAEDFTLDQVGNWKTYRIDADGDGDATGAGDLDQDRTVNDVNEVTGITEQADPQQTAWADPVYSARGNMTTVPQPADLTDDYSCTYDAWNRLVEVKDGQRVHARYEYDGLNRRVKAHIDSDASGGPDTWVHFYYTNEWQLLETRETTAAENTAPETLQPGRQVVWSVRYTDALVRRDTNTDTDDLCDDETLYALGDANSRTAEARHAKPLRRKERRKIGKRAGACVARPARPAGGWRHGHHVGRGGSPGPRWIGGTSFRPTFYRGGLGRPPRGKSLRFGQHRLTAPSVAPGIRASGRRSLAGLHNRD